MTKNIIIIFICSLVLAQVVPPEIFNNINTNNIPGNIPSITTNQRNVSFSDYAIYKESYLGTFSYLKINSSDFSFDILPFLLSRAVI